jgi:hypothetical protein
MRYLDYLTDSDLSVLASRAGAVDPGAFRQDLSRRPWGLGEVLSEPDLLDDLLDPRRGLATEFSPFLVFAAAVFHSAEDLRGSTFVSDWVGPRERLPVFGVETLCEFLEDPARCLFLASLLASFATPERTAELDPYALAVSVNTFSAGRRMACFRRLGDLALFLAGVLPDYTGSHSYQPQEIDHLGRSAGLRPGELLCLMRHPSVAGLELMEVLGARWYRLAASASAPIVGDVANRFGAGRRVLTHLSDRYLFRIQPQWLAMTA